MRSADSILADLLTGRVSVDAACRLPAPDFRLRAPRSELCAPGSELPPPGELARRARAQGIAGLLYCRLKASGGLAALESADAVALERRHAGQVARSAIHWPEIDRVLAALQAAGIPFRLLKGAALALTVYDDPAERPMDDLDLLIPEGRVDEAVRILGTLGYEHSEHVAPPKVRGTERLVNTHVCLLGPPPASLVCELHWTLVAPRESRYSPDIGWFWEEEEEDQGTKGPGGSVSGGQRSEVSERADDASSLRAPPSGLHAPGSGLRVPSYLLPPTQQLLHLCAHLMLQHPGRERKLIWFYDIHTLMRTKETGEQETEGQKDKGTNGPSVSELRAPCSMPIDWDVFVTQAVRFHWTAAAHAALAETQALFGMPLPDGLLDRLRAGTAARDAFELGRRAGATTMWDATLYALRAQTWSARIRTVIGILFPSRDYFAWRYPKSSGASRWSLYRRRWRTLGKPRK